jgi:AcrR family transcriptional regulator
MYLFCDRSFVYVVQFQESLSVSTMPKHFELSSSNASVRDRILEAAEFLYASNPAASVRDIAALAQCQLSSVTYHFGSKDGLFETVIARRAGNLCERRLAALDSALVASPPTTELVLGAFLQPYLKLFLSSDLGWQRYAKLLAHVNQVPEWETLAEKYFNPTARIFINSLCSLNPGVPRAAVARAFVFTTHLVTMTFSGTRRAEVLSDGEIDASDLAGAYQDLLLFCAAGSMRLWQR